MNQGITDTWRGLGLDFGATRCRLATLEGNEFRDWEITPPMLHLWLVAGSQAAKVEGRAGLAAGRKGLQLTSFKRLLGTNRALSWKDERVTVQETARRIMTQAKERVEGELRSPGAGVALAVSPAASDSQRAALKAAAEAAGWGEVRLLEDSRAAALAWYYNTPQQGIWLIYSLGASAFSVSVFDTRQGVAARAYNGDGHLGGLDFDAAVVAWLSQQTEGGGALPLEGEPQHLAELYRLAEATKVRLGTAEEVEICLPGDQGHRERRVRLTKERFEALIADDLARTVELTRQTIAEAGLTGVQMDAVFLLGRSTRLPGIKNRLWQLLGVEPQELPGFSIARGAALYAAQQISGLAQVPAGLEAQAAARAPVAPVREPSPALQNLTEVWERLRAALDADDPEAAIAGYHRLLETAATPLAGLYRKKAAQLAGLGEIQAAVDLLENGIRLFPGQGLLTEKLAELYFRFAWDFYQRAAYNPKFANKYLTFSRDYLTRCLHYQRHYPQALELKRLLEVYKKTGRLRNLLR